MELDYKAERQAMVLEQLQNRGIHDKRTIRAMSKVPRELFVPKEARAEAYADSALPIEEGQTISQPYMIALLLQAMELHGDETVLEVGTGSGYTAALLSHMAAQVVSVERYEDLAEEAKKRISSLGIRNVHVYTGDGSAGWMEDAPYDAIVFHAGAPDVPPGLFRQLRPDGRIVIPVASSYGGEDLMRIRIDAGGKERRENLGPCYFVPLVGKSGY